MLEMIEDIDPGAISETIVVLLPHLQTGQLALPSSDKNNYSIYMKSYRIMLFNLKKSTHSLPHERFVQSKTPEADSFDQHLYLQINNDKNAGRLVSNGQAKHSNKRF